MLSKSHPSLAYFVRNYISNEMFTCASSIMFMIFHPQLKITQTWTVPRTVIWGGPKSWVCQRNTLPQIILQIESYFPPSINQSRRSQNGMINKTLTCSCLFDNYLHYLLCFVISLRSCRKCWFPFVKQRRYTHRSHLQRATWIKSANIYVFSLFVCFHVENTKFTFADKEIYKVAY